MPKIIHGNVCTNGDIKSGYDFKVTASGQGIYTVDFLIHFQEIPTVVVTQVFKGWDNANSKSDFSYSDGLCTDNAIIVAVSKEQVKIKTGSSDGKGQNRSFAFMAMCDIMY